MGSRTFQLRVLGHYDPALAESALSLERINETGTWEPQVPSLETPPFRLHLISILLCLKFHLLAVARERTIPLQELAGSLTAQVSDSWDLESLVALFHLTLADGASPEHRSLASSEALTAMEERMRLSPVPRNRPQQVPLQLSVLLKP